MPKHSRAIVLTSAILAVLVPASILAIPSAQFYQEAGEIFDDWDICRTDAAGEDGFFQISSTGFRPIIVGESLGTNADQAYRIGQQFAGDYSDTHQRGVEIFAFARDRVRYSSDESQFSFPEFAQNADELAATIEDKGVAHGDCEDYAVLLAVMYKGAGFRSAIVLTPEHAAALVYLPEYRDANQSLSVDGEAGWIWAEATGGNNPLGWMPEEFLGTELEVYEVDDRAITKGEPPDKPSIVITPDSGSSGIHISPFFIVIGFLFLISLLRRRR
ncbi:MAG: transglutaminase domain-containing protein [Dehalococcoidia bacterium]